MSLNFIKSFEINIDDKIKNLEFNIKEFTPEKLLEFKGFDVSEFHAVAAVFSSSVKLLNVLAIFKILSSKRTLRLYLPTQLFR